MTIPFKKALMVLVAALCSAGAYAQAETDAPLTLPSADRFIASDLVTDDAGTYFTVSLEGDLRQYCAYNLVMTLPAGVAPIADADGLMLYRNNDDGMTADDCTLTAQVTDGKLRIICYSSANRPLGGISGKLFDVYVDVADDADPTDNAILADGQKLVTTDLTAYTPADGICGILTLTTEDGIHDATADSAPGAVYDLAGRRVSQPVPGHIYIINERKTIKR